MSGGYKQQPGGGSGEIRKDGKRVAGKQSFAPPGSGGSSPVMKPRDLDFIPEMVGGKRSNRQGLTFTIERELVPLLGNQSRLLMRMQKLPDKLGTAMMSGYQMRLLAGLFALPTTTPRLSASIPAKQRHCQA